MRLRTFGSVSIDGAPEGLGGAAGQRRPLALLLLLADAGDQGLSRDKLIGYLWGESDRERSRNALRQTLYVLRRDLNEPDLVVGTTSLRLNRDILPSDLSDFDDAFQQNDLEQLIPLYTGPLADGFFLSGAPEFERWLESARQLRAQQYGEAVRRLAEQASARGDSRLAVDYWRRLAAHDALSGAVARKLIEALAESGDRTGALQHAKVHEAMVRDALGVPPDDAVAEAIQRIRTPPEPRPAIIIPRPSPSSTVRPDDVDPASPDTPVVAPAPDSPPRRPRRRSRRVATAVAIVAVTAVGSASGLYLLHARGAAPVDATLVAVAPFHASDPSLDVWAEGMMDVLSHTLDGAGRLRTVASVVLARTKRSPADRDYARELARRTRAGFVVYGSLTSLAGDSVVASTSVLHVATDEATSFEIRAASGQMGRLADSLRASLLLEFERRVPIGIVPAPARISKSTEALRAFLEAEQSYRRGGWESARAAYEHAIEHDSGFSLAYHRVAQLSGSARWLHDPAVTLAMLRAGSLNHGLGPRDSLLMLADSLSAAANVVPTDIERWPLTRRLLSVVDQACELYGGDPEVWLAAGEARYEHGAWPTRKIDEGAALGAFDRAIALDSALTIAYLRTPELALSALNALVARRYIDAYVRQKPTDAARGAFKLLRDLLAGVTPSRPDARFAGYSAEEVYFAHMATRHWPDSAETAIRLDSVLLSQSLRSEHALLRNTNFLRAMAAEDLAFRGRWRLAQQAVGATDTPIAFELRYPPGHAGAAAAMTRLVNAGSKFGGLALRWWASRGDSASVRDYLAKRRGDVRAGVSLADRLAAAYDTAAASAYLALIRRDTADALNRFMVLPDTLCVRCYGDRLTRASLLAARGRDREALAELGERFGPRVTPLEVLFAFERGRIAERTGATELAVSSYRFVEDAWRLGDAEARLYADSARQSLRRLVPVSAAHVDNPR